MAKRVLFQIDSAGWYMSILTCCHKTVVDGQYNFCPFCASPLEAERDDTGRLHDEPRWERRAKSLGIDPLKVSDWKPSPMRFWAIEGEYDHKWTWINYPYPTRVIPGSEASARRQALAAYRQAIKTAWPGWAIRLALVEGPGYNIRECVVLGRCLEHPITEQDASEGGEAA